MLYHYILFAKSKFVCAMTYARFLKPVLSDGFRTATRRPTKAGVDAGA